MRNDKEVGSEERSWETEGRGNRERNSVIGLVRETLRKFSAKPPVKQSSFAGVFFKHNKNVTLLGLCLDYFGLKPVIGPPGPKKCFHISSICAFL